MAFDKNQIKKMQHIFKHLEPSTIESIQTFTNIQKNRTNCTFGVKDKKGNYVYIFQYFENLSTARKKILEKRKNEVPFTLHFIELANDFVCVGWKF